MPRWVLLALAATVAACTTAPLPSSPTSPAADPGALADAPAACATPPYIAEVVPGSRPYGPQRIEVRLSDEIRNDARALSAHTAAARVVEDASQGRLRFVFDACPTCSTSIAAEVNRGGLGSEMHTAGAAGSIVQGGRLIYADIFYAGHAAIVLHEFGHLVGLDHTTRAGDAMCNCPYVTALSQQERDAVLYLSGGCPAPTL